MEGLVAFSHTSNTCPPCLCDCSSQPLLTIPEVDKKVMPGMENEGSNLSRAEEIKNQANEEFKAHKYGQAINLYTQAIELNSQNAVYWANPSLAHTKLEEYGSAIQDATKAIEVDPKYSKEKPTTLDCGPRTICRRHIMAGSYLYKCMWEAL
ncbi:hypothetical protein E1A91_A04G088000v1 [Gossypium mustelinum]|nr:hypothetical protein E1A91_A04G088000v1 [Gossypium mustelinum]